ncbi:hypothetical protein LTR85_006251 [Meristemomyces frigidus]|nr:hypothetical protein LTR85_006251 [Meristemomyces frigidus]
MQNQAQTGTQDQRSSDTRAQAQQTTFSDVFDDSTSPDESPLDPRVFDRLGGRPAPGPLTMNLIQERQRNHQTSQPQQPNGCSQSSDESSDQGIMLAHSSRIATATPPLVVQQAQQPLSSVTQWVKELQPPPIDESSDADAVDPRTSRPRARTLGSNVPRGGFRSTNLFPPQQATRQQSSRGESSDSQRLTMRDTGSRTAARRRNTSRPQQPPSRLFDPNPPRTTMQEPSLGHGGMTDFFSVGSSRPRPGARDMTAAARGRSPLRSQQATGYLASNETSPGSLGTLGSTRQNSENRRPAATGSSTVPELIIPPTSTLPPLTGRGPALPLPEDAPIQPRRRSSMQDYLLELQEEPADPTPQTWAQIQLEEVARVYRPPRQRRQDKSFEAANTASRFAGDDGYFHPDEYLGFTLAPGLGYCCTTCSRVVQQPLLHTSNGMWCFDACWDPLAPNPESAPVGVDVEMAMQQAVAGGTVVRDFAPGFHEGVVGWGRADRRALPDVNKGGLHGQFS